MVMALHNTAAALSAVYVRERRMPPAQTTQQLQIDSILLTENSTAVHNL